MTFSDDVPTVGDESTPVVNAERGVVGESSKLNEQMEIIQGKLSTALARIEELANENETLTQEVRTADDRNLDLSQELENAQNDAKMAKGELESLQMVSETKAEELSKKNSEAISEWTKYEEMATMLEEEVNMLKSRLEESEQIRTRLHDDKEKAEEKAAEHKDIVVALDANEAELLILREELSETKDKLRTSDSTLHKTEKALADAQRIIESEGKVNWEEKCKEEMERREKVENDLWESRRLLKEEKKKVKDSEEHIVRVKKELEDAEKRRVKQQEKLQKEISSLWQKETTQADNLKKTIDDAKLQERSENSQRIAELTAKLNVTTKDYNSLKNRLGTAERELANTKRKAKKQGGSNITTGGSADFILVKPEPKAPESPVEEWKRWLNKLTWKHWTGAFVAMIVFLHIFFPSLVTTVKY